MGTQLPHKGHSSPPKFLPVSIVAKWLDGLALGTEVGLSAGDFVLDDTYR